MTLEPLTPADLGSLAAFQPEGWLDIVPIHRYYLGHRFCIPMKIQLDGGVAGIGTGIVYAGTGWLAHIIVHPEHRRRGIGHRIVAGLLELLEKAGCTTISLIATEAGYPVYLRAGFTVQTEYLFLTRGPVWEGPAASDHIETGAEAEELLRLDREVTGEDRSGVLRGHLQEARVYRNGGTLSGFYLPALADGPIVAGTSEAGLELMKLRCARAGKASVPSENSEAAAFLTAHRYAETGRYRRMVYGRPFDWNPRNVFNRIGGNFG